MHPACLVPLRYRCWALRPSLLPLHFLNAKYLSARKDTYGANSFHACSARPKNADKGKPYIQPRSTSRAEQSKKGKKSFRKIRLPLVKPHLLVRIYPSATPQPVLSRRTVGGDKYVRSRSKRKRIEGIGHDAIRPQQSDEETAESEAGPVETHSDAAQSLEVDTVGTAVGQDLAPVLQGPPSTIPEQPSSIPLVRFYFGRPSFGSGGFRKIPKYTDSQYNSPEIIGRLKEAWAELTTFEAPRRRQGNRLRRNARSAKRASSPPGNMFDATTSANGSVGPPVKSIRELQDNGRVYQSGRSPQRDVLSAHIAQKPNIGAPNQGTSLAQLFMDYGKLNPKRKQENEEEKEEESVEETAEERVPSKSSLTQLFTIYGKLKEQRDKVDSSSNPLLRQLFDHIEHLQKKSAAQGTVSLEAPRTDPNAAYAGLEGEGAKVGQDRAFASPIVGQSYGPEKPMPLRALKEGLRGQKAGKKRGRSRPKAPRQTPRGGKELSLAKGVQDSSILRKGKPSAKKIFKSQPTKETEIFQHKGLPVRTALRGVHVKGVMTGEEGGYTFRSLDLSTGPPSTEPEAVAATELAAEHIQNQSDEPSVGDFGTKVRGSDAPQPSVALAFHENVPLRENTIAPSSMKSGVDIADELGRLTDMWKFVDGLSGNHTDSDEKAIDSDPAPSSHTIAFHQDIALGENTITPRSEGSEVELIDERLEPLTDMDKRIDKVLLANEADSQREVKAAPGEEHETPRVPLPEVSALPSSEKNGSLFTLRQTMAPVVENKATPMDTFREDELTVLILRDASKNLTEADFRKILPRGRHIKEWIGYSQFMKVIPLRKRTTLAQLPHYFIVFPRPSAARAFADKAKLLHAAAHAYVAMTAPSPPDLSTTPLESAHGATPEANIDVHDFLRSFTLLPPSQPLDLRFVPRPYPVPLQRALQKLHAAHEAEAMQQEQEDFRKHGDGNDAGGTGHHANGVSKVLLRLEGHSSSRHIIKDAIALDSTARGLAWDTIGDYNGVLPLRVGPDAEADLDAESSGSARNSGSGSNSEKRRIGGGGELSTDPDGPCDRFVVRFGSEEEARRFAREWHRRRLKVRVRDWMHGVEPPVVVTELMW